MMKLQLLVVAAVLAMGGMWFVFITNQLMLGVISSCAALCLWGVAMFKRKW